MKKGKIWLGHLIIEVLVLLSMGAMLFWPVQGGSYRRFANDMLSYVRGTVEEILSEELSDSTVGSGQKLGLQTLAVRLPDGQTVEIDNYLTEMHNVYARPGQRVIVCVDATEGVTPYYSIYNYDRTTGLMALGGVFLLLMLLVGGRKGFDAFMAIGFTVLFLIQVALPKIFCGGDPVLVGFSVVLLSTAVTLLLLHGPTLSCLLGACVTLLGEIAACLLFWGFSHILHLTGFQTESAEDLLLIAQNTGLQVRTLLHTGTMIASLGAVMDVAVSILSSLREVARAEQTPSTRGLFRSGMNIGRDMIGTMSNTLIFAFTGGALATMLVFYSYGVQFHQLLSSDYLTLELTQGLCSTAAVILTVPAAALVAACIYPRVISNGRRKVLSETRPESK